MNSKDYNDILCHMLAPEYESVPHPVQKCTVSKMPIRFTLYGTILNFFIFFLWLNADQAQTKPRQNPEKPQTLGGLKLRFFWFKHQF
jgi:hypothetical protein